ncbi:MAG TPA: NAD(P)H-hydrate dehydratase [Nevskiaceae bacterium]
MQDTRELYGAAGAREFDRRLIEGRGVPGYALMCAAAQAVWREAGERWPQALRVVVYCGGGNNGGDGFEVARLARRDGRSVRVVDLAKRTPTGDAARARAAWQAGGGTVEPWSEATGGPDGADLVVDAIFGTGLSRPPDGMAREAIAAINAWHHRGGAVLSVDTPSGLDVSTGAAAGDCVEADATVTFIARKFGLHTGVGPDFAGAVRYAPLVAGGFDVERPAAVARLLDRDMLLRWFPRRRRSAHKGNNGHVLIIGGDHGMVGAVLMAARAALRCGAGLVTVATRADHAVALAAAQPEAMFRGVADAAALAPLLARADVVAIGPGLGQSGWSRALWRAVRDFDRLVVDADALNLLAEEPHRAANWILTPHPGETGRLLGLTTAQVQHDRRAALLELARRYGGYPLLKGAGTLVYQGVDAEHPETPEIALCPYGNPGMAVGGMGDVLTGVVAACLAQGMPPGQAAAAGVTVHALAGDAAARGRERGLLPSDLIAGLRSIVNPRETTPSGATR